MNNQLKLLIALSDYLIIPCFLRKRGTSADKAERLKIYERHFIALNRSIFPIINLEEPHSPNIPKKTKRGLTCSFASKTGPPKPARSGFQEKVRFQLQVVIPHVNGCSLNTFRTNKFINGFRYIASKILSK